MAQFQNAFQSGQQFFEEDRQRKASNVRAEARNTGIRALADEFGEGALAPNAFSTIRSSDRADRQFVADEDQRGIGNRRDAVTDARKIVTQGQQDEDRLRGIVHVGEDRARDVVEDEQSDEDRLRGHVKEDTTAARLVVENVQSDEDRLRDIENAKIDRARGVVVDEQKDADRIRRHTTEDVTAARQIITNAQTDQTFARNLSEEDLAAARLVITQSQEDEDRITTNQTAQTEAERKAEEFEVEKQTRAARSVVAFYKRGIENGVPMDVLTERAGPALAAIGIDVSQHDALTQSLLNDPTLLDEMDAALQAEIDAGRSSSVRAIGKPEEVEMPDGTVGQLQYMSDGSNHFTPNIRKTKLIQAGERIEQGADRVSIAGEKIDPDSAEALETGKARGKAVGKAQGEIVAEDLPTSKTAIASQEAKMRSGETLTQLSINSIRSAREQVSSISTGFIGGLTDWIPGTPAYKLVERLLPTVSQEFVQNLQNMRDLSKTGGAVGNVSNAEGDKLQALRGSLKVGQGPEQLLENMEIMENAMIEAQANIRRAWEEDQAARANVGGRSAADQALIEKHLGVSQ